MQNRCGQVRELEIDVVLVGTDTATLADLDSLHSGMSITADSDERLTLTIERETTSRDARSLAVGA